MNSIVNISEGTTLAVHGLGLLAQKAPERMNVKDAARRLNSSEAHLAKVFGKLQKRGWVSSVRGPYGGFSLKVSPDEITFLDVYELFEEVIDVNSCPLERKSCPFGECTFNRRIRGVITDIHRIMRNTTISDLNLNTEVHEEKNDKSR